MAEPARRLPRRDPAGRSAGTRPAAGTAPSLREERRLLRSGHRLLAAVDEVGRGALAGPVSVGVVLVSAGTRSAPTGVRDSKLLTPAARAALVPRILRWAPASAVGHAEPGEIDEVGIMAALRLAAARAMAALPERPDCVLLDGNHDWISGRRDPAALPLFGLDALAGPRAEQGTTAAAPPVVTRIKADLRCAAVAAASVLAKVERDSIMIRRAAHHPQYGWELNKGYSAPEHFAALRRHGPCAQHRQSWSLPGLAVPDDQLTLDIGELEAARPVPLDIGPPEPAGVVELGEVVEPLEVAELADLVVRPA